MNLLSGLEKFGLDQMDTDHLFEEEKSDTPARKAPEPVPKKEPVHRKLSSYWINPSVVRYVIMFSVQEW